MLTVTGVIVGTTLWARSSGPELGASGLEGTATTTPVPSTAPIEPATSTTAAASPPTSSPVLPTTNPVATVPATTAPSNLYGDPVGAFISEPATAAARFAVARATGGGPAGITTAYFVLVWARWRADTTSATVTANASGYVVDTLDGPQVLSDFVFDEAGLVRNVALGALGTPTDPAAQTLADGTCAEGVEDCAGFQPGLWSPSPDITRSPNLLWRLATVGVDPAANVWIMIPGTPGGSSIAQVVARFGEADVDPSTGWIFMSYGKNPPGGSADQRLDVTLSDGSVLSYEFTIN